ncbi:glutathione s-transferase [Plakobranchus ocellatus]|uniref:Glutathione s-transferase n=1 Tax=Plakobranchus ocellatus TaxID=259542 RepID=A0AAV3ZQ31_9GAST|nr:glutathione s-transferase [Plakobranchus ocellatus]
MQHIRRIEMDVIKGNVFFVSVPHYCAVTVEAPNHTLPYIEYQGNRYGEALPIARFLARKYKKPCLLPISVGLLGRDELEQFQCDILINQVDGLRSAALRFKSESLLTEQQKKDLEKEFKEEKLPEFLGFLEEKLASSGRPWLIGNNISFADLLVFDLLDRIISEEADFAEKLQSEYPLLDGLKDSVASVPQVKAYLDTRPETFS